MRNEDQTDSPPLAQRHQKPGDLHLHGHIQRRGRLVCDQHLRVAGDRQSDSNALAHAAGELVRIKRQTMPRLADAYLVEKRGGRGAVAPGIAAMRAEHVADLSANGEGRV